VLAQAESEFCQLELYASGTRKLQAAAPGSDLLLNPMFTRVVNHCVIVVRTLWDPSIRVAAKGRVLADLEPRRDNEMRRCLAKKAVWCNILRRFAEQSGERMHALESAFVYHAPLKFRLGLSQSVFEGRRRGVPT
jgi:hypothetical protein